MKKFNYLLLGAAALVMASCSQDDIAAPGAGDGNVNITVKLPAEMATRALSDGLTADVLHIAVYDADADNAFVFQEEASFGLGNISTTVSLNLPQGKTYNIAFFAVSQEADGKLYQWKATDDTPSIYVDYNNYASDLNLADKYDCFYKLHNTGVIPGTTTSQQVMLTRPVAQINWGTNDLSQAVVDDAAFGQNGQKIVSNFTMSKYYNSFSLLDNDVIGEPIQEGITIYNLATPASTEASADWAFPVNPTEYKYIAMQYVLAPAEQGVYDLSLDVHNTQGTIDNEDVNVSSAPVQANYRTNIYGALLTNPNEFVVTKDKNWAVDDKHVVSTPSAFEAALAAGGPIVLNDNVTINSSNDIDKNVSIDLNGYNITYTGSTEGAFYVKEGGNLTINGNGNVTATKYYTLVYVDGGEATINGGYYYAPDQAGQIVYVMDGTAYVNGGSFVLEGITIDKPYYYPLNCLDASYDNGNAHIIVTGGAYLNFDPNNNIAEGSQRVSFLAPGYKTVTSTDGTNTWFMVVPENYEGGAFAADSGTLAAAVSNASANEEITVLPGSYTFPSSSFTNSGIVLNCEDGVIFTGNTNFTTAKGLNGGVVKNATFSNDSGSAVSGNLSGTFENCIFEGKNGVYYASAAASDIYFSNCSFIGNGTYAYHTGETAGVEEAKIHLSNCNFNGYVAVGIDGGISYYWDNCLFTVNPNSTFGGGNFYGNDYFSNCTFDVPSFTGVNNFQYLDLNTPDTDYSFTNCYLGNGEMMDGTNYIFRTTKDGVKATFNGVEVELPNNSNL